MVTAYDVPYLSPLPGDARSPRPVRRSLRRCRRRHHGDHPPARAARQRRHHHRPRRRRTAHQNCGCRRRDRRGAAPLPAVGDRDPRVPRPRSPTHSSARTRSSPSTARCTTSCCGSTPAAHSSSTTCRTRSTSPTRRQRSRRSPASSTPCRETSPTARHACTRSGWRTSTPTGTAPMRATPRRRGSSPAPRGRLDSILDHLASWWNDVSRTRGHGRAMDRHGPLQRAVLRRRARLRAPGRGGRADRSHRDHDEPSRSDPARPAAAASSRAASSAGWTCWRCSSSRSWSRWLPRACCCRYHAGPRGEHPPTPPMTPMPPYWGEEVDRTNKTTGEDYGNYEYAMMTNNRLDSTGVVTDETIRGDRRDHRRRRQRDRLARHAAQHRWTGSGGSKRSEPLDHGAANDLASNPGALIPVP